MNQGNEAYAERIRSLAPTEEPERQYYFIDVMKGILLAREEELGRKLTMNIQTFGCQMNAKDSETLAGILSSIGYLESDSEEADLVLYNTCTVRENANTRVYGRIGYLGNRKKLNPEKRIILCGCMMQEPQAVEKIRKSYRFVDVIFGTHNIYKLAELLFEREISGSLIVDVWDKAETIVEDLPRLNKYGFKAGINIMYGCNNFCSYCIVPYVRGRERSRSAEDIVEEARHLAACGVREVMLLGQNVNSYGKNTEGGITFAQLLARVSEVEGIRRIRFMTPHPKDLSDELIEEIARNDKVCKHVHLPLQSGSSSLLKAMNRHYTKEQYLELVAKIKERIPGVAVTTDIIVGFPGETEADFEDTCDVVRRAGFMSAYTFLYSKRTETPAAKMENQIPDDVAGARFKRLLEVVGEVSSAQAQEFEGQTVPVLCEEYKAEEGLMTGRMDNNLLVHFPCEEKLLGELVTVKLDVCKGFYYLGTLCSTGV
ncbi:MAG: tRNA (N6-isopentenyl adenosine(37)-C2)-methylthiotransferase MiaB [Lachnospiraceae bacterium]|nr:tRNA (N6-isopentenyl adenosine(37)-C2)-methylthiotransferase MiaB [Lachnospiraceae bacterium]